MPDPIIIKVIEAGPQGVPAAADVIAQVQERVDALIASASEERALAVGAQNAAEQAQEGAEQALATTVATAAAIAATAVSQVRDGAPSNLDTLNELAAAIEDDPAFATTIRAYVDQIVAAQDAMVFKGVIDASANPNYPAGNRGWTYRISVAGRVGGGSGKVVEVGDILICLTDATAGGTEAAVGAQWSAIQTNIDGAVTLTGAQTLTNKTLTSPVINSPTGIVKANVGLGSVDNTSDASKPVSTAQAAADDLRVLKAGDTMTGPLTLSGAPTNTGHATTKQYVDRKGFSLLHASGTAAAVTGTIAETVLATITLPAGSVGPNGVVKISTNWSHTNNANVKTLRVRLGGPSGTVLTAAAGVSQARTNVLTQFYARNSQSSQIAIANSGSFGVPGQSTSGQVTASLDLSVDQTIVISGECANAGDTITLESRMVEIAYAA